MVAQPSIHVEAAAWERGPGLRSRKPLLLRDSPGITSLCLGLLVIKEGGSLPYMLNNRQGDANPQVPWLLLLLENSELRIVFNYKSFPQLKVMHNCSFFSPFTYWFLSFWSLVLILLHMLLFQVSQILFWKTARVHEPITDRFFPYDTKVTK